MFGGFGKLSSNTNFGKNSANATSPVFGQHTTGNGAKQDMKFGNCDKAAAKVFGHGVFGNGGSSASSLFGVKQTPGSVSLQGSSTFTFGKVASNVNLTWHPAISNSSSLFPGSSGSKSDNGGFPSVFGQTTNTSGSNSLVPEKNSFLPSKPTGPSGFTCSKLTPLGHTNASNVPVFGNTWKGAAPAFDLALNRPTWTSSYASVNPAFPSGFSFGRGDKDPSGMCLDGGNQFTPYQPTPLIDNEGKKTAEKVQSISAMPDNESKSHEELRWEDYQSKSEESRLENFQGKSHEELRWEDDQSKSEESRLENFQGKSPEELRWEDYQCHQCIGLAESAVQPNKKIGGETPLLLSTWSNTSVEKPTFSTPNIHNNKVFGTFTGPRPEFPKQLIVTHSEVTLEPTENCPNCCSELRSTALWVVPQPAQPPFPCFPEQAKPAQECKVPISKDPLQTNQGITFPTILLDAAKTPSEPSINKISPVLSVADVQLVNMGNVQPAVAANPFGTRRETSPITHFHSKSSLLIQQGVSSMPVISTPTPVKTSSWVTCRHLSRNRIKLPARRPPPMNDNPKVPFFCSHDELPRATKGQSWIIARENPKAWVGNPTQIFSSTNNLESESPVSSDSEGTSVINPGYLIGRDSEDDKAVTESLGMLKIHGKQHKQNCRNDIITSQTSMHETPQLPKLQLSDYYTKPSLEELAAKEKANSEFLSHVKDFVVGRYGYGHIKFMGETDVRQLDITSIIKFNHREVLIYPDETTKPPIGKGLNKPAEITLLSIKVITRNSGREYTFEEKSEKFKKMLIQKAKDNGAEFISYDPVAAEWKFSVPHFGCN